MRTVPITELRQRIGDVIAGVSEREPIAVMKRSRPAAYIVHPDRYDRDQAELSALRRALFLSEVREAEAEYQAAGSQQFDDVEELLDAIRS